MALLADQTYMPLRMRPPATASGRRGERSAFVREERSGPCYEASRQRRSGENPLNCRRIDGAAVSTNRECSRRRVTASYSRGPVELESCRGEGVGPHLYD